MSDNLMYGSPSGRVVAVRRVSLPEEVGVLLYRMYFHDTVFGDRYAGVLLYDLRGLFLEKVGGSSDVLESDEVEESLRVPLSGVEVPFRGAGAVARSGADVHRRYREGLAVIAESCAVNDFVEFVLGRRGGS